MTYREKQKLLFVFAAVLAIGVIGSIAWMVWYDANKGHTPSAISASTHASDLGLSSRDLVADIGRVSRVIQRDGVLGLYLARFQLRAKRYPARLEELLDPSDGSQPVVGTPQVLNDPWNRMYQYRYPGEHPPQEYDLWSLGPDGVDGTEDDITNW